MTDYEDEQRMDEQIAEVAVEWVLTLEDEVDEHQRAKFKQWLAESEEHWKAYNAAKASLEEIDDLGKLFYGGVSDYETNTASPIVDEPSKPEAKVSVLTGRQKKRRWALPAALAAAASLVLAIISYQQFESSSVEATIYTTDVGQQRQITLADNSTIHLNTRTQVAVELLPESRRITLLEGEALFDVGNDPLRPFSVYVRDAEVRALGTRFNVYKKPDAIANVTLLEGRVKVSFMGEDPEGAELDTFSSDKKSSSIYLEPGAQAVIDSSKQQLTFSKVNVNDAVAWRDGKLVFNSKPLSEVVEEFNRYDQSRIVIRDPMLKALEITGTFDPYDRETFIKTLRSVSQVHVTKVSKLVTLISSE